MADGISREEKLAAGLKKLKQFQQQRQGKTKTNRKKLSTPPNDSSENLPKEVLSQQSTRKLSQEVPSPQNLRDELEQAKKSSSSINLSASVSTIEAQKSPFKENGGSIQKSKSELQLSNSNELSSSESLRQISLQLNGLMSDASAFMNGGISDSESRDLENKSLEKRNQELALLSGNLRQANDQLQFQLQELKAKNKRQIQTFDQERKELLEKSHKEQVSLKDQLQVHIQTIGILVAEKTELQSSLSLSQQTAKQKAGEVEELQGRLRASRQRASDLERELNSTSTAHQLLDKTNKETAKDLERYKTDNYKSSKMNEELKLANAEITEKLSKKINELQSLEAELAECRSKISMNEAQAQSTSFQESEESRGKLEEVCHQKFTLEKEISCHKDSIAKLIGERDQMSEQYQQYIQQLSQQLTSLRDEMKQLSQEKEQLAKEKLSLSEKLEENSTVYKEDPSELNVQINILNNKNEELMHKFETEKSSNANKEEQLQERDERIEDLERRVARMKADQVDHSRLAETMQSDKVAASRAVAQNRELKKQLEELQNCFVDMSNNKLDLAEKLHSEQHICKELGERLSQQEEELVELRDQLSLRETELQTLHASNTRGIYQQNQITDRMRHYEAQGQLADMLQKELHAAQEQINSLTNQNSELRMALATQTSPNDNDRDDSSKRNDLVESLSASVRQLEMERNQMMMQLEQQKSSMSHLKEEIYRHGSNDESLNGEEGGDSMVSRQEYAILKNAMAQLEERFKQTMNRIAELSDERQQLEHLVMQLQGETDTIGDYIALYQIQRGLMRKRASEKDDYIAQLATDREDLKEKLTKLQNLVLRLLEERKQFQSHSTCDNLNLVDVPDVVDNKFLLEEDKDSNSSKESKVETDVDGFVIEPNRKPPENTAKKIIDLLTEIETTNLVEKPVIDTFHPCSVCSGRLLTV